MMKMPGFSAEASLYRTARQYSVVATLSPRCGVTLALRPRNGGNGGSYQNCISDCGESCVGPGAAACMANCKLKCSGGGSGVGGGGGGSGVGGGSSCSVATAAYCGAVFVPFYSQYCGLATLFGGDWCMCMMTSSHQAGAGLPDCWPCVQQWFGC
jgi:hypothetical protein